MRIGCIYTLKNEEDLILQNISYHRFIGVTDFFVFLDYSTDRTKETIQQVPNLHVFENMSYSDMLAYNLNKPDLDLDLIRKKFAEHNGVRQIFHGNMALEYCRAEHIDWLISIDPDEIICIDPHQVARDSLADFFSRLDTHIGAVIFRNLELMPTKSHPQHVFEGKLFKNVLVENLEGLPKTEIFNPYTQTWIPAGWFWGHTSGKLSARVLPNSYFTHLTHLFRTEGEIITRDYLLHHNILSFQHFLTKYRNFKNFPKFTSLGRQVRPLRTMLVELVNDPNVSYDELLDYYLKYIVYTPEDIDTISKVNPAAIVEIDSVANFLNSSSYTKALKYSPDSLP